MRTTEPRANPPTGDPRRGAGREGNLGLKDRVPGSRSAVFWLRVMQAASGFFAEEFPWARHSAPSSHPLPRIPLRGPHEREQWPPRRHCRTAYLQVLRLIVVRPHRRARSTGLPLEEQRQHARPEPCRPRGAGGLGRAGAPERGRMPRAFPPGRSGTLRPSCRLKHSGPDAKPARTLSRPCTLTGPRKTSVR